MPDVELSVKTLHPTLDLPHTQHIGDEMDVGIILAGSLLLQFPLYGASRQQRPSINTERLVSNMLLITAGWCAEPRPVGNAPNLATGGNSGDLGLIGNKQCGFLTMFLNELSVNLAEIAAGMAIVDQSSDVHSTD